mgnify:CR=1 FL=1
MLVVADAVTVTVPDEPLGVSVVDVVLSERYGPWFQFSPIQ